MKKHWNVLSLDDIDKEIFNSLPLLSFSREKNVQEIQPTVARHVTDGNHSIQELAFSSTDLVAVVDMWIKFYSNLRRLK